MEYVKCKFCKNEIPSGSIFCNWCGERLIKERKKPQEISVPKPRKLPSGRWTIQLRAEGESVTEDTADACIARAKAVRAGWIAKQPKDKSDITLSQAIDKYIETRSNLLSPTTIRGYRIIQKHRFKKQMSLPVTASVDWRDAVNHEFAQYSPKTVKNSWRFIASVLAENGVTVPTIKLPQRTSTARPWLDFDQILRFLTLVKGEPCELAALFALHSLRRSEIFALRWEDIDLVNKRFSVTGTVIRDKSGKYARHDKGKSDAALRTIPIMIPALYNILKSQQQPTGNVISGYPDSLYDQINRVCKKGGLPCVGVHGLRHSFASLAYHVRMSETETMQIGGWADFSTVHNIYLHLAEKDRLRAENAMAQFYNADIQKQADK